MNNWIISALFLALVSFSSYGQHTMEIKIASEKVSCANDETSLCFQAKKLKDPYWTFQIDSLDDFEYVEGIEYTLKVEMIVDEKKKVTYRVLQVLDKKEL